MDTKAKILRMRTDHRDGESIQILLQLHSDSNLETLRALARYPKWLQLSIIEPADIDEPPVAIQLGFVE